MQAASSSSGGDTDIIMSCASNDLLIRDHIPLLGNCIRFLNQTDRLQAARVSRIFLAACCSPASWRCDESALERFLSKLFRVDNECEENLFSNDPSSGDFRPFPFQCPTATFSSLAPAQTQQQDKIHGNRIFAQTRCLEVRFDPTSSIEQLISVATFKHLEHLILHLEDVVLPEEVSFRLEKFPASLKSLSLNLRNDHKRVNAMVIPLLPASLHTLIIKVNRGTQGELGLQDVLPHLAKLETLVILSNTSSSLQINTLGLCSSHSPSLRILTDFDIRSILQDVSKAPLAGNPLLLLSQQHLFCARLSHMRLADLKGFKNISPDIDWAPILPNLTSLHISAFSAIAKGGSYLPASIGARVLTLVIDSLPYDPTRSTSVLNMKGCFGRHGLTNLTSLTFQENDLRGRAIHLFDELSSLTYLSFGSQLRNLDDFKSLRKLQTLVLESWPKRYLHNPPRGQCQNRWEEIDQDIQECLENSGQPVQYESLAKYFPSLTTLKVNCDSNISDAIKYVSSIPNLKYIGWDDQPMLHVKDLAPLLDFDASYERIANTEHGNHNRHKSDEGENTSSRGKHTASSSTSSSSSSHASVTSTVARHFNLFNLALAFQSLSVAELSRASSVSKHWRSAAFNPQVLRHQIRIERFPFQIAKVHGPQLHINNMWLMVQVGKSAICRNVGLLALSSDSNSDGSGDDAENDGEAVEGEREVVFLPGESEFGAAFLRLIVKVPSFRSLHTLTLNLSNRSGFYNYDCPTADDLERIRSVMSGDSLKYLKVLRMKALADCIYVMLPLLPKSLEIVELQYVSKKMGSDVLPFRFADSLAKLPKLVQLSIDFEPRKEKTANDDRKRRKHRHRQSDDEETHFEKVKELQRFCSQVSSDQFDEVIWHGPMSDAILQQMQDTQRQGLSFVYPYVRSIYLPTISTKLLSKVSVTMPHLREVVVEEPLGNSSSATSKLRNFTIKHEVWKQRNF